MAWSPELFGGILSIFTVIPSLLILARIFFDVKRFRKHGYLPASVISLACAVGAWVFLMIAIAMVFWRSERRIGTMLRKEDKVIPDIESLGKPLFEATVMHSYVVPTGLWLCKASFIAMYFNLKRHCSKGIKILLHCVLIYVILSYVVLVLTHALWCGHPNQEWAHSSRDYCLSFTSVGSISIYSIMNVTSDLMIMGMPLLMIRSMQVRTRERWAIMFLLFLGLAMVVTTLTCCALHVTYRNQLVVYYSFVQTAQLLAVVELSVCVAAVSLPSLKAVLYRHREQQRRKSAATYSHSGLGASGVSSFKAGAGVQGRVGVGSVGMSSIGKSTDEDLTNPFGDEDRDTNQLVIMRRMSYDVHSQTSKDPEQAV